MPSGNRHDCEALPLLRKSDARLSDPFPGRAGCIRLQMPSVCRPVTSPLAFHAAAPGEWINDPNALWHGPEGWTLLVQHRADAPAWQRTGWGRFRSPNLMDWTWHGPAIPPEPGAWAYSGCVRTVGDALLAVHTEHAPGNPPDERQVLRRSTDGGSSWSPPDPVGIPPRHARRDPFLYANGSGWRMLLARPCAWTGWETEPASVIETWESADLAHWKLLGEIGPRDPPGMLWEVPILLPGADGTATLLVSRVDRRDGRARSDVRWWHGRPAGGGFEPLATGPLDFGPDFYAATVATDDPGLLIGWLSSWDTARDMPWPGFAGGPIALPRRLSVVEGQVHVAVEPAIASAFHRPAGGPLPAGCGVAILPYGSAFRLTVAGKGCRLLIEGDPGRGTLRVERMAPHPFDWSASHRQVLRPPRPSGPATGRTLRLFLDGPVVELFLEPDGLAVSAAMPTTGPLDIELGGGRFCWFAR